MNNEAITNNRLTYLDIAEGFGILCVIAGHMGNETKNFFTSIVFVIYEDF